MTLTRTEHQRRRFAVSQRIGVQLLMLLLFFYFSYSAASELGIISGLNRKFEGHLWLGRIMGAAEFFGGLALLREEGALGGACFLAIAMASGTVSALLNHETQAAVECLLMFNICIGIAYWRRLKALEHS